MYDLPSIIIRLVWLALPIFTFVISLKAKQRLPGKGSSLMVIGSGVVMLVAFANSAVQYWMELGSFSVDNISSFYLISGVLGAVGQIFFLSGLYQFIEAIGRSKDGRDLLDYLPD